MSSPTSETLPDSGMRQVWLNQDSVPHQFGLRAGAASPGRPSTLFCSASLVCQGCVQADRKPACCGDLGEHPMLQLWLP